MSMDRVVQNITVIVALLMAAPPIGRAEWARKSAIPLATVEPMADISDLAAFGEMIGDARVVGLGEATHGTREIFQMKHRLLRYLAEEKGFDVFSIESNLPSAYLVGGYVQGGDGDVEDLIGGMYFWTWNTVAVRDMVEWMREYNASGGLLHFTGFDMQSPAQAAAIVWSMAERLDAEWASSIKKRYRGRPDVVVLREIEAEIDDRRAALSSVYDVGEVQWMRRCARLVFQGLTSVGDDLADWQRRDAFMADNVAWIAAMYPNSKIVLWAHNGHILRHDGAMGSHLQETFGDDYVPVGFVLGEGRYKAVDMRRKRLESARLGRPRADSLDAHLGAAGYDVALFDLRDARSHPSWLQGEVQMRSIGAAVLADPYRKVPVAQAFDLLIYLDKTTATRQLPRRPLRPPSLW